MTVPHPPEANPNRSYSFVGQENISQITGFEKGLRATEHTDFGTITILFQDSTGDLEVEDQENWGSFHSIESTTRR